MTDDEKVRALLSAAQVLRGYAGDLISHATVILNGDEPIVGDNEFRIAATSIAEELYEIEGVFEDYDGPPSSDGGLPVSNVVRLRKVGT